MGVIQRASIRGRSPKNPPTNPLASALALLVLVLSPVLSTAAEPPEVALAGARSSHYGVRPLPDHVLGPGK